MQRKNKQQNKVEPKLKTESPLATLLSEQVAATIRRRAPAAIAAGTKMFFPSGSTMLDCALSDNANGGIPAGKIINIVADSGVGKTMLAETMVACIANDSRYDEYNLYFDDAEFAMEMDAPRIFGKKAAARIIAPWYNKNGTEIHSTTVESWYASVMDKIRSGKPFIYILDSVDSLTDSAEYEAAEGLVKKAEAAIDKGDGDMDIVKMEGSYGMAKPKMMSQLLRTIKADIARTGSVVVIISQVRANVGARPGQKTKRQSCGEALKFYCTHVVWLSKVKTLKGGKGTSGEVIGSSVKAEVTKNKMTGKIREVAFDIFYDYGIDNTGSCVDFLCDCNVLKKKGAFVDASILGYEGNMYRDALVRAIEDDGIEQLMISLVQQAWEKKEGALKLDRKPRFAQ